MTTGDRPSACFDSGLLVKLYHLEAGSAEVARRVRRQRWVPLVFLAEIEIRNALRVLHGRGRYDAGTLRRALAAVEEDVAAGRLRRLAPEEGEVRREAEELSDRHAAGTLCRTLDILHVAYARVLGARTFHTGDRRQADLAKRAGLRVSFLEVAP